MMPQLGHVALGLAFVLALVQAALSLVGAHRGHAKWMALGRHAAFAQCAFVSVAFLLLVGCFVANDFSVDYVAANSNSRLPLHYRVSGVWGGHEGSVLLWVQMLAGWAAAVCVFSADVPASVRARVMGVMGLVSAGFLAFVLFTSNPFDRTLPAPPDGRDLNPLLQDWGMVAHPPMLYMGYVGFSVAFAFAIAALLEGRLDAAWARWTRRWTLQAWACLTIGIVLGSVWAYAELGWGGWWFWDAVENASLMPWLVGTALVHSLAVAEKRATFKNWTVLLAIAAFSLSLLGTFLVRSGVLSSVHAFASDPQRGLVILVFLAVVIGGALALYAWRAPQVGLGGRFVLFSRESLLLVNNVLLAVLAGTVLLGTLYPVLLDALDLGKISVGPPYFEAVFVPLAVPLLLLTAVGPRLSWKEASLREVARRLAWVALAALLVAAMAFIALSLSWKVALGLALAAWIGLATAADAVKQRRRGKPPLGYWGMALAHGGVAAFVVGVTLVKGLESSSDHSVRVGDTLRHHGHDYTFASLQRVQGPNYIAARATFEVRRNGEPVATLHPQKRLYVVQRMPMTEAAIDRGLWRDLYVSLNEVTPQGAWLVRVQHKPFMGWVWGGALAIALGGLLAAADRRLGRRSAQQPASAATVSVQWSST